MTDSRKKVVILLNDLLFTVKIQGAAKRAGLEPVFVKSQTDALASAKEKPVLIILDLNHAGAEPLETISKLKANPETKETPLLGYVSHVQGDVVQAARARGCDVVVARSAFSQNLLDLLRQYAET